MFAFGLCVGCVAEAQVTNTAMAIADAFVCTGSTNYRDGADLRGLNFGDAGALAIAAAASAKGEFQSLLKFNLAASVALSDLAYGPENWSITGVSLELTGNYGTGGAQPNNPIFNALAGGRFVIEWLADDDWREGTGTPNLPATEGVSYTSLTTLLAQPREALCTNTYSPPGNNIHMTWALPLTANLVADIAGGGDVTLRLYAAEEQVGYFFNSYKYGHGNEPVIHVVATPALRILSVAFTNGVFRLTGQGNNRATYRIEANAGLSTPQWQTVGTTTADSNGTIRFDELGMTYAQRFYRLSQ